jgi:hypothetical protein
MHNLRKNKRKLFSLLNEIKGDEITNQSFEYLQIYLSYLTKTFFTSFNKKNLIKLIVVYIFKSMGGLSG